MCKGCTPIKKVESVRGVSKPDGSILFSQKAPNTTGYRRDPINPKRLIKR